MDGVVLIIFVVIMWLLLAVAVSVGIGLLIRRRDTRKRGNSSDASNPDA